MYPSIVIYSLFSLLMQFSYITTLIRQSLYGIEIFAHGKIENAFYIIQNVIISHGNSICAAIFVIANDNAHSILKLSNFPAHAS